MMSYYSRQINLERTEGELFVKEMGEKLKGSLQGHRIGWKLMLKRKLCEDGPLIRIELNNGRLSGVS